MEKKIIVLNENGIHARPAGMFVKEAGVFDCDVFIEFKGNKCNGKSIMNLMVLGLKKDDEINLITSGSDEEKAMEVLSALFQNKFGE